MSTKIYHKTGIILVLIIFLCLLTPAVLAFETRSGDTIEINTPINDDLLASGGSLVVNAPVKSITWAGGTLIVNQPIETNLIAMGGTIQVNAPIGSDLVAMGGDINIKKDVGGKVLAMGGSVTMDGNTNNIAASGGTFILGKGSTISKDAIISSSGYTTQGIIKGNLTVEKDKKDSFISSKFNAILNNFLFIAKIVQFIGLLILGVILIKLLPDFFKEVTSVARKQPFVSLGVGVISIILSLILFVILLITIIGIPIAVFWILLVILGLILSTIITGGAVGQVIINAMNRKENILLGFLIGFILLNLIFLIPLLGFIIWILAICFGFGALVWSVYHAVADK
jgi:hypothetical protein